MNIHTFWDSVVAKTSFNGALANSTQAGTGVDTQGYRRAALYAHLFTGAATTAQITISDSPDNSTWTIVTGGTDPAVAVPASTADTGPYLVNIDLAKRQRYLRVNVIGTGTAGNAAVGFLLFEPLNAGVTNVNTVITL
jgi:hypothetical protein